MKNFSFLLMLLLATAAQAQSTDKTAVQRAALNYIEGFYEGDTVKLKQCLNPSMFKYGYWRNKSGQYDGEQMTFKQAIDYAKGVLAKKNFAKADAPKEATVLDVQEYVACAKVTAWWGIDYLLLSKKDGNWKIEQILWQGPLSTIQK